MFFPFICLHSLTMSSCYRRKGQGKAFLQLLPVSAPLASTPPKAEQGLGLHCEGDLLVASQDRLSVNIDKQQQ